MDPRARQEVLKLFIQLSHAGKTLVIASHQLEELASVSHDISLMQSGRVISTSHLEDRLFDLQAVTLAGLLPPLAVQISQALIEKGWPIAGRETSTPDRLISALQEVSI
jgi:ABC-type multidrug transport system ATPase subunit